MHLSYRGDSMKDIVIMPKQSELIYDCYFKIEEMVLLCVITAIDNAMTEKGENWFANFKSAEANESKPVISDKEDKHFSNICDLDFQAAIKCLAFRKKYFSAVWEKYGIDKDKCSDFTALLFRLIKNRNDVSGHFDVKSILSKYSVLPALYSFWRLNIISAFFNTIVI